MLLTVELTLYPLQDHYLTIIKQVVEKLNALENVKVRTFPTATIIQGDFDLVMDAVKDTISWCYSEFGKSVFLAKYLPEYEAI